MLTATSASDDHFMSILLQSTEIPRLHAARPAGPSRLEVMRLLEACPRGLLVIAQDGTILYANAPMARLLGVERSMLTGADVRFFHARALDYERQAEIFQLAGRLRGAQTEMRRIGGGNFSAEVTWEETQFGGQAARALWVEENTARKLNEETLTCLFESAPLPMLLCNARDGSVHRANRRATELFIMGRKIDSCGLEDIIGTTNYRSFRHSLHDGGFVDDFEVTPRTAYGESFFATLSGQIVSIADERCILVGITDITDRKHAEQTLRRFFEVAPLAMLLVRMTDNTVLRVNRRGSELLTVRSAAGGASTRTLDSYVGIEAQTLFLDQLHEGGFVDAFEARLTTDYGESIWVILSGQIVEVDDERCMLVGVTDITDRKLAEEQLLRAEAEAVRATQVKSLFLATMSHEIRTPMNGVLGMLEELTATEMTGEQSEMVDVVRGSAVTLLTIIDDILDLSKIEAGRLHLERVGLSLRDTIETAIVLLASKAQDKDVELAWCTDPAVPDRLLGDPTRLRQILLNLLGNAVKFTSSGWVALRAMTVGGKDEPKRLRFEVQDTGIGLSPEQQTHLFQPFTQADASTTRRFGGTGLGLSICRRLVAMMGGVIGVDSSEGAGACFWFEIPLAAEAVEAETPAIDLSELRILVADDLAEARDCVAAILGSMGAVVQRAATAEQALELARGNDFDLALVDADGGFEALETHFTEQPEVSLLHLSCQRTRDGNDVLAKPLRRATLLRGVSVALGRIAIEQTRNIAPGTKRPARAAPTVEEALAAGRLILVAEDNFTNRLVIGKQLARLGYACEMAEDGEAAWAMLERKAYGLLLTDCAMPRLDGYGLSARLRASEAGTGKRLPIVALTAYALDGDMENCVAAGMNDYLSKPIALDKLALKLERWLPPNEEQPSPVAVAPPPPPAKPAAEPPVDLAALGELLGDDDPALLTEILQSFVESFRELGPRIRTALSLRDRAELRDAAHTAKGAARNACTPALAEVLAKLEAAATGRTSFSRLNTLMDASEGHFAQVEQFVLNR
jgi:PAS domain S-box-containing protein